MVEYRENVATPPRKSPPLSVHPLARPPQPTRSLRSLPLATTSPARLATARHTVSARHVAGSAAGPGGLKGRRGLALKERRCGGAIRRSGREPAEGFRNRIRDERTEKTAASRLPNPTGRYPELALRRSPRRDGPVPTPSRRHTRVRRRPLRYRPRAEPRRTRRPRRPAVRSPVDLTLPCR